MISCMASILSSPSLISVAFASGVKVARLTPFLATDYVDKWTPMVTSVEFLNDVIKGLEVLIIFLNVLFILFCEDKILGRLSHRLDGLFVLLVIEVDFL